MRRSKRTRDPVEIRLWMEARGGAPAFANGAGGALRIDFDADTSAVREADWVRWFGAFEDHTLTFHFDAADEGRSYRLVRGRADDEHRIVAEWTAGSLAIVERTG
ncbi:MAG TPA: hypothetical protein VK420_06695 [Longimicrobium sp.]|jgi:hypothetical protein|nr:hypothetical protein [Longimicrobium sp.]